MHYQKNYLTNVILRFDFESLKTLRESIKVDVKPEFSARLAPVYSIVLGQPTATLSVNVGPTGSGVNQQNTGIQWNHRKVENGTRVVVLAPDFLSIEYGKGDYDHFPPFREEAVTALQALQELYKVPKFTRIGLRYVNDINFPDGNALDWEGLLAPELITAVRAGKGPDASVVRSMHQIHTREGERDSVITYGLHNSDFPNTLARRSFILDYDCSQTEVDSVRTLEVVDGLNKCCEGMFERSIEKNLRDKMGEINAN